ncbi:TerD family protein [Actinomadura sp. 21ATH]|uniref:TerD family protein n=1 Tax=Actinomadura sp. 21ATH TaxID=1735444 RepID=UPI0035BED739
MRPPGDSSEWALVDVETSGLRAHEHRVLSLAVVTVDSGGTPTGEFSTLLDPGCDPGPVHVHGLTRDRLRGAPAFEQVGARVAELLSGRVMVAHNAPFDYGFLAREFARAGLPLPVRRRMCTLALNRRLAPPTADLRLGTLAAHYGVRHGRAHEALEDARALAGVLRGSLDAAARIGLPLPLVACPPKQNGAYRPRTPKVRCAYRSPGRLVDGGPLVQGMKVAITGETRVPREELAARAATAGLNVMASVSRHTGVLVANDPASGTAKARRALAEGVPVLDEEAFLRLLDGVREGVPHDPAGSPAPATAPPPAPAPVSVPAPRAGKGPLAGRRVLVVGGTHPEASGARTRVVELGGAAAVNLSASVTDVVVLAGGEDDRRMARVKALELPVYDGGWLGAPVPRPAPERPADPFVLVRGAVADLPVGAEAGRWTVAASWAQHAACEVDVVAFALDADEQVTCDEDFVFYGQPEGAGGAVTLSADGPAEQAVTIDLAALPGEIRKVVVAAAVDGAATFGELGAVEIAAGPGRQGRALAQATLDAGTTERTMLLAEIYRRGGGWRLRAVGQGYESGLGGLATGFGVDVEDGGGDGDGDGAG